VEPYNSRIRYHHRCFCGCDVADELDAIHTPPHHTYNDDDGVDVCGACCGDGSHDVLNYICGTIPFHFVDLNNEKFIMSYFIRLLYS